MANWGEFAAAAPEIAERGWKLFAYGHAYIGTPTLDGSPNVHPITPLMAGGRLVVFVEKDTAKCRSLLRDGRYAIHAVLGQDDEEFLIRGRAEVTDDPASQALAWEAARAIGMTSKNPIIMEFMIERAHWAIWEGLGTPDIRRVAKRWRAGGGSQAVISRRDPDRA